MNKTSRGDSEVNEIISVYYENGMGELRDDYPNAVSWRVDDGDLRVVGIKPGTLTTTPRRPRGARGRTDDLTAEVARAIGYAGASPFQVEEWRIEAVAEWLARAGYRRVVEDAGPADGCLCSGCGVRYRVDFNIPDDLWHAIGMDGPGGLLCGRRIADRIEKLGDFDAFALRRVVEDEDTVERVARALAGADSAAGTGLALSGDELAEMARVAIRTVRDGIQR